MRSLVDDLRHALRGLRKSPGFTAAAVATLALGIGANTAIFSVADAALLRPFDVPEPDRLVAVFGRDAESPWRSLVYSDWVDLRRGTSTLEGPAAFRGGWDLAVTGGGREGRRPGAAERVEGALVSGDYFSVLRVPPVAGRSFTPAEAEDPSAAVAVASAGLARRRFGSPGAALGETLIVNREPFRVVGVAPAGFRGVQLQSAPELWLPLSAYGRLATGFFGTFDATDYEAQRTDRRIALWRAVGRLRPGASLETARAELETVARRLAEAYPATNADLTAAALPAAAAALPPARRGESTRFLLLLLGTVGLLLLLACANVANLLLARAARRRGEMGMRMALGAGPGRLLRQLLAESSLLAVLGGGAGLAVAVLGLQGLGAFRIPGGVAVERLSLELDGRILAFTLGLALLTSVVFGLGPALRAIRTDPISATKGLDRRSSGRRSRLRDSLVAAQVALCTVLLVGAGLFVRSLREALAAPLGFEPANVATLTLDLGPRDLEAPAASAFYARLLERTRGLPGVRSASLTSVPFGEGGLGVGTVWAADRGESLEPGRVTLIRASRDHFATLGHPLLAGRTFGPGDAPGAPSVAVVSRSFAERVWPGAESGERVSGEPTNGEPTSGEAGSGAGGAKAGAGGREGGGRALGRRFNFSGPEGSTFTVVGVVGDASQETVGEGGRLQVYLPLSQHPDAAAGDPLTLHVRTEGDPLAIVAPVREVVRSLDPAVPVYDVGTLRERVAGALWPQRMGRTLLGLFGLVALLLAGLGIYAVAAYEAARRNREMGIRVALGAVRRDLVKLVLGRGMIPVAVGLGAGLLIAAGATRAVSGFLYGVESTDPIAYALAALLLGGTATVAFLAPARRASRVDPAETLREE